MTAVAALISSRGSIWNSQGLVRWHGAMHLPIRSANIQWRWCTNDWGRAPIHLGAPNVSPSPKQYAQCKRLALWSSGSQSCISASDEGKPRHSFQAFSD